jgi:hypothetical protein
MALANYSAVFDPSVVAGKPLGNPSVQFQTGYLSTTCAANQGAGPFRFVCHDQSSMMHSFYSGNIPSYTLEPNPYYYGRKPRIMLEYRTYPNNSRAYVAGMVDASAHLTLLVESRLRTSSQYHEFPSSAVDNAARYSAIGSPIVVSGETASNGVSIAVRDEGPGLAPEDAKRVFERFYRVNKSRSRGSHPIQRGGGSGLGLSIVQALVQQSKGEIRIDTGPQRGTTVAVTLPGLNGSSLVGVA